MGLLITSPHDSALLWLEDQGVSEAFTAQSQMRTACHPTQTCNWPSNCVYSLLQVPISFSEPITPFVLPEPLRGSPAYMASGLSEDTVLESMSLPGSGRPLGRWFCYTFGRRAALHVTLCDSQRTGCSPWSVTWRARAGRRQEALPHLSQLKTGLSVGAHTGLSSQEASHRICRTVSLRRLSWHLRMYYLRLCPSH